MAQSSLWVQRMADKADLHGEVLPGVPVVELAGDRRILIERHRGVSEYSGERICVRLSYGLLCISGCGMALTRMTKNQLIISGCINEIRIERGCL